MGALNLHNVKITSPDGLGHNTTILLDGKVIYCNSIKLEADGVSLVKLTIVFDGEALHFNGMAEVVAELREKAQDAGGSDVQENLPGKAPSEAGAS